MRDTYVDMICVKQSEIQNYVKYHPSIKLHTISVHV